MMKLLNLIGFCFILNFFVIQVNENKKEETVFVFFDQGDSYQSKRVYQANKTMEHIYYIYTFLEENYHSGQNEKLQINYNEFADFDEMERNNPVPVFKVNKSFVRKNKEIILTRKKMHKMGFKKTIERISNAKTIFLIERDSLEKNKVIIKEVIFGNTLEE